MVWRDDTPSRRLRAGSFHAEAAARCHLTTLHFGRDGEGRPGWVRRGPVDVVARLATDHQFLAAADLVGATVPPLLHVDRSELWFARVDWAGADHSPCPTAVDKYVSGALRAALRNRIIIGTGDPHVTPDGGVVCEDAVVACRLEVDQVDGLSRLWEALVGRDAIGVADAAAAFCGYRPPGLADAAVRAAQSIEVSWSAVAVGLALHHLACVAAGAGPRSEPLVLIADELLHRLDLAHAWGTPVPSLSSPNSASSLR